MLLLVFIFLMVLLVYWSRGVATLQEGPGTDVKLRYDYLLTSDARSVADAKTEQFQPSQLNQAPASFGVHNHWHRLTLTNQAPTSSEWHLIFDNPTLDSITIYPLRNGQQRSASTRLGDEVEGVPASQRALPSYAFQLDPDETLALWIHLETVGSSQLSLRLLSESQFHQYEKRIYLLWGHFVGILIIMVAYNAVLYSGVRDQAFLYYIGYLISIMLMMGTIHGYGYLILPVPVQLFLGHYIVAVQSVVGLLTLAFARSFLRISREASRPFALYRTVTIALYLHIGISFLLPENSAARLFEVMQLLIYISIAAMIVYQIRERFRWTRYYIISWLPFFAGALIGLWLFSGWIDYSFYSRHALMFGMILEMILISMALADRMGEAERIRLYNATHDVKTGLANDYYLASKLSRLSLISESKNGKAIVGVKLANYEQIGSYINEKQRTELLVSAADVVESWLQRNATLLSLDPGNEIRTILYNDSLLLFLLEVSSEDELNTLLAELENHRSVHNEVLPFRLRYILAGRFLDHWDGNYQATINSILQSVSTAMESGQRVVIYSEDHQRAGLRSLKLAQDLEQALEDDELTLYLQPQQFINGSQERVCEVLARWSHPVLGMIPPDEFIGIAERTGLISALTQWVIQESFRISKQLKKSTGTSVHLSINISASDLSNAGFAASVVQQLSESEVNASEFTLEVTETAHNRNQSVFRDNLMKLSEAGFCLAIDDFGTGYSSLTYVSEFPFAELKVDRSLVTSMVTSDRQQKIIRATIEMAHGLNLRVTAEGIEDEATLELLKTMGCEKIQGYFCARPMPVADYLQWLIQQSSLER